MMGSEKSYGAISTKLNKRASTKDCGQHPVSDSVLNRYSREIQKATAYSELIERGDQARTANYQRR